MVQPVTVSLDIAKNVFHAHGLDSQGQKVLSRKLRRGQVEARSRNWAIGSGSCRRHT